MFRVLGFGVWGFGGLGFRYNTGFLLRLLLLLLLILLLLLSYIDKDIKPA